MPVFHFVDTSGNVEGTCDLNGGSPRIQTVRQQRCESRIYKIYRWAAYQNNYYINRYLLKLLNIYTNIKWLIV